VPAGSWVTLSSIAIAVARENTPRSSSQGCRDCAATSFVDTREGDRVCTTCGLVVGWSDAYLADKPEWVRTT
jgi:hypothetical protein